MKKNQLIALVAFIAFALLILAVVPPPASVRQPADQGTVTETYEGTTPCADCPGIVTRLTLTTDAPYSAEGTYELSLTYLERDVAPYVATGLWTTERGTPTDPDATVYALDPDMPETTQRYLRVDAQTIRQLDREGNEIDADLPFDLTRIDADTPGAMLPERKTVSGTGICLPHKDTSGPQTMECAQGFKSDDGQNYALDLAALEPADARTLIESGAHVELEGMVTPIEMLSSDHWMKYDAAGIISVTSARAL